jgi:hypothetical protein
MPVGDTVKCVIDGKAVKFKVAEELGFASDRWIAGREQTRWSELEVVRTAKGKYVLRDEYVSMWQGEQGSITYTVYDTLDELVATLDPTKPLERKLLNKMGLLESLSEEI